MNGWHKSIFCRRVHFVALGECIDVEIPEVGPGGVELEEDEGQGKVLPQRHRERHPGHVKSKVFKYFIFKKSLSLFPKFFFLFLFLSFFRSLYLSISLFLSSISLSLLSPVYKHIQCSQHSTGKNHFSLM